MNSSRPLARYHSCWRSWRLQVDWLAQTTLYQVSQAQTAGCHPPLSKTKRKNNPKLVPARLAAKLHFRCCRSCRNIYLDVGLVTRLWLCSTVSPTAPVRSTHDQWCTRQASVAATWLVSLWQWCNGKAIEALAGRRPTARWCCLRKLVFVRLPLLP